MQDGFMFLYMNLNEGSQILYSFLCLTAILKGSVLVMMFLMSAIRNLFPETTLKSMFNCWSNRHISMIVASSCCLYMCLYFEQHHYRSSPLTCGHTEENLTCMVPIQKCCHENHFRMRFLKRIRKFSFGNILSLKMTIFMQKISSHFCLYYFARSLIPDLTNQVPGVNNVTFKKMSKMKRFG